MVEAQHQAETGKTASADDIALAAQNEVDQLVDCLLYTSPSPRD